MLIYNELMWHFLHLYIISGNHLRFLGVTFRHVLAETTTGRCSLKEILIKKEIDNEKNIKKLLRSRLLDFLLFHTKGNQQNL